MQFCILIKLAVEHLAAVHLNCSFLGQDALLQTSALMIHEVLGDSECHFWSGSLCAVRQVVAQVVR
jgi:hypothetical protein